MAVRLAVPTADFKTVKTEIQLLKRTNDTAIIITIIMHKRSQGTSLCFRPIESAAASKAGLIFVMPDDVTSKLFSSFRTRDARSN